MSLQVSMATLAVGEVSTQGRQSVTLALRCIPRKLHTEVAAQSPRKILHCVLQSLRQNGPQLDHKSRFSCRVLM
jgi:hypothetical protein